MKPRDVVETRVLGAVELIDSATGLRIQRPLKVTCPGLTLVRNRSALLVITGLTARSEAERQLRAHLSQFDAPLDEPETESITRTLSIEDPLGTYMPREAEILLPRRATLPDGADPEDWPDLFKPIGVDLYLAPAATPEPNWSGVRLSLRDRSDVNNPVPLAGALVGVTLNGDSAPRASGMTDERGEGFVPVPGVPITVFVDDDGGASNGSGNGGSTSSAPVESPTVTANLSIRSNAVRTWPANPDQLGDTPITWVPLSDPLPAIQLKTGEIKHVRLDLTPQA